MSDRRTLDAIPPTEQLRLAEELARNPFWQAVLLDMANDAIETWKSAKTDVQRNEQWYAHTAIQMLNNRIMARIESARMQADRARRSERQIT